jgi:hypothetical protein
MTLETTHGKLENKFRASTAHITAPCQLIDIYKITSSSQQL